jgi:hypothetical protein
MDKIRHGYGADGEKQGVLFHFILLVTRGSVLYILL